MSDVHLVDATMFWSPTGGGVRRYLTTKHAWLGGQAGWRHTLAVPAVAGALPGPSTLPSWPLPGSGGYRLPWRRRAMADVLVGLEPDLIEAGDPYRVAWAVRDAADRAGVPCVAYCHSNLEAMARMLGGARWSDASARWARRYVRHVYAGFDLVLAPSRSMVGHLLEAGVVRVACQPLGVDTQAFAPSSADARVAWRRSHGIADGERMLIYAGRFAAEKHLDVLADSVARLGAPYRLVCIGAGPLPPPAGGRVVILPFASATRDLAAALGAADAFVHAGDQETFGLSVLEAMACATPVVVRDAEGLAEMVDAGCGVGVRSGSADAFAAAIASLFDADAERLRGGARQRAERHDWKQALPHLLGHYRRLLPNRDLVSIAPADPLQRGASQAATLAS